MIIEEYQISIQARTSNNDMIAWNSGARVPESPDITFQTLIDHLKAKSTDKYEHMKAAAPNTNPNLSV